MIDNGLNQTTIMPNHLKKNKAGIQACLI